MEKFTLDIHTVPNEAIAVVVGINTTAFANIAKDFHANAKLSLALKQLHTLVPEVNLESGLIAGEPPISARSLGSDLPRRGLERRIV